MPLTLKRTGENAEDLSISRVQKSYTDIETPSNMYKIVNIRPSCGLHRDLKNQLLRPTACVRFSLQLNNIPESPSTSRCHALKKTITMRPPGNSDTGRVRTRMK